MSIDGAGSGRLERTRGNVLREATRVLATTPQLTLGEIAAEIGIGRTTLHRMFATRHDLLVALADDALDHLEHVQRSAGLSAPGDPPTSDADSGDELTPIERWTELMVPLGPRLLFLLRAHELSSESALNNRIARLDDALVAQVERCRDVGLIDPTLPPWWIVESLNALLYVAWEQVDSGRLAARDAASTVLATWRSGVGAAGP